jgi:3-phytase
LFAIDPATRKVSDAASAPVFTGENSDSAAPMGIALYKRPGDGAVFAIVGRKSGPAEGYLWQYRVADGAAPALTLVRKFGKFSGTGEITSIVVDDERGYVYYADERSGIRKYYADPDHADAATELAHFGTTGYTGDRKGLAIAGNYLISTDQVRGESHYLLYWRDGTTTNPHDHSAMVESYAGADATEGIEATLTPLGPRFPQGMLVTMNRTPKNFLYWAWPPPRLQP